MLAKVIQLVSKGGKISRYYDIHHQALLHEIEKYIKKQFSQVNVTFYLVVKDPKFGK